MQWVRPTRPAVVHRRLARDFGAVVGGGYCRAVSTALYRRYRPESFADVIGQEHVTEPLMQALRTGRVNHA